MKHVFFVTLMMSGIVLLSSCGSHHNNVESGNKEGILHMGNGTEPQDLDPHVVTGVPEHHIIQALLEGLVYKDPNDLSIKYGAAESHELSEGGRVYTFKMRKGATWSNGDPVTAYDFEWSWKRALQPKLGNQYVFMFYPIKNAEAYFKQQITDFNQVGIKALDDETLRVELQNPTPYFLQLLDHYALFPVHKATIEKFGSFDESYTQWTRPGNFIGNGPFVLKEWRLNKHILVTKNEKYWGAKDVRLNAIKYYPIDKETTEERMFRAGQLHMTTTVPIDKVPVYQKQNPEQIKIHNYLGTYYYRINLKKKHLADVRVRKALAMSIDVDTLTRSVLKKLNKPASAFTPPNVLTYKLPKGREYNPEKARQLLAEAGYPNGEGFPVTTLQYNTQEMHRKIAVAVQQMLRKNLNIQIRLQNKDWKVYLDDQQTGNYDISRAAWIGDYVDPNTFLDMWITNGGNNQTGWSNVRYDELVLKEAPATLTNEERFKKLKEAETILMDAMPIIPIYTYSSRKLQADSVKNTPPNVMNYMDFRQVYLDDSGSEATKL